MMQFIISSIAISHKGTTTSCNPLTATVEKYTTRRTQSSELSIMEMQLFLLQFSYELKHVNFLFKPLSFLMSIVMHFTIYKQNIRLQ